VAFRVDLRRASFAEEAEYSCALRGGGGGKGGKPQAVLSIASRRKRKEPRAKI